MTTEKFYQPLMIAEQDNHEMDIPADNYTNDEDLKHKARSINLIKYNPHFFTNQKKGSFTEIIGGTRASATILLCGAAALFYRLQANKLRRLSSREGVWFSTVYFSYGCAIGCFYSGLFFWNWQRHLNDIWSNFLLRRFPNSSKQRRTNIYSKRNIY
jgi:hypothetical protein